MAEPVVFAVRFVCQGVEGITPNGEEHYLTIDPEGWVSASSRPVREGIRADLKIFESTEAAEDFIRNWAGWPWYTKPNGEFVVFPVQRKVREVLDGYQEIGSADK